MKCPKCGSNDWDWANIGFSEAKQCLDCGEIYMMKDEKTMTMPYEEQQAFIEAYDSNVSMCTKDECTRIVEGYYGGLDVSKYDGFYSVLDCLMMWHEAVNYKTKKELKK